MFNTLYLKCLQDLQVKMSITQLKRLSQVIHSLVWKCTFTALVQYKVSGNKNSEKVWAKEKGKRLRTEFRRIPVL